MSDCTGYACPPENGEIFTPLVTHLAITGPDPDIMAGGIITAGLFIVASGILFTYNHLRNKE